jgi:adenosylcobalamin-dependent ribonucleoside-triphosphate reductase
MLLLARITSLFNSQMGVVTWKQVALIEHWIALAVISGGTRRSARMLMKYWQDPGIFEFIKLKEHLPTGHVPHHTTNISVVVDKKFFRAIRRMDAHAMAVLDAIVFNMLMNGEPGLVNASNQLIDEIKGAVFYVLNPCGEITMVKYDDMYCFDVCCIGHLNLATLEDPDGKAKLLARFLMRASMAKIVDPRMKMNVDRNHRLGAGILGYADWLLLNGVRYSEAPKNGEVKKFFSHLRDRITEEANNYAHTLRVVAPIKTTTIAPTGTIANLSGVTSGMQPVFAQYYIRRVRYADTGDQQTLDNLRSQGYNVYQDPYSPATSVVDFVTEHVLHGRAMELFKQKHPELPESEIRDMVDDLFEDEGTLTFTDVFANQEMLQECWANNAISVTANVRRETDTEELRQQISEVTKAILFYGERLKGLTMFPEVSMAAAPLERLTKEEFNKYREEGYPIDVSQDEQKCVNGVCPIK